MGFFLYFNMKKRIIRIAVILFGSIVLWASVSLSDLYITTIKVPVKYTDLPKNYAVGFTSIYEIEMQVKGKGWELAKLLLGPQESFEISVHKRTGRRKYDLNDLVKTNTWLTSNFQVLEMSPSQIEFEVEKIGARTVKLIKNFKIEFKPGYGPSSEIKIVPDEIEIYGAANVLQKIDSIKTEAKEIKDVSENVSLELNIDFPEGVTASAKSCLVEFEVQKIVDKTFENVLVETRNVPPSKQLILFPARINIVLRGGINKLGRLTNDSVKAYVDYWSALKEEHGKIEPVVQIPRFITLTNTVPNKLDYIIKQ